jgi:hypothetical protein
MPSQIPIGGLDRTLDAFFVLLGVCLLAAAAMWLARLSYAPHRIPEFSELSAEQIRRRKTVYTLVQWVSALAVTLAFLLLVKACTS